MAVLRHRDRFEGDLVIEVAFTGVDLDLGDRATPVIRDRALSAIAHESGASPVLMRQVHGCDVAAVEAERDLAAAIAAPTADAMVATQPGVALLARAADCVPVLLGCPDTGLVSAVHAGRQGLVAGVVGQAITTLRDRGASRIVACIGPHVCGACYEVPDAMAAEVDRAVPGTRSTTSWGTAAIDLGVGVEAQLAASGVTEIRSVPVCTREDPTWPSYRRDGEAATRFAGMVWSHS
jgi:YfiH family protein